MSIIDTYILLIKKTT